MKFFLTFKFWSSILLISITFVGYVFFKNYIDKYITKKKRGASQTLRKKLTLLNLFTSLLKYILLLFDVIIILGIFGIKVTAFLAGLGILSIVIGIALQDLLKDFIAGLFIVFDSQYDVGDYVEIAGFKGEVITVGLKSTKIRDYTGDIKIFSNRNVENVINFSKTMSKAVVIFTFKSDIDFIKLEKVIEKLLKKCDKELDSLIGSVKYKGVQEYENGKITIKLTADVKPLKQFKVESSIKREAKLMFDKEGIAIL